MSVVEIADLSCSSAMFVGCAEGELEVSQRDRILGVIGAGKAFGELAVLYNCQRTASVRGQSTSPASSLSLSLSLSLCLSLSDVVHSFLTVAWNCPHVNWDFSVARKQFWPITLPDATDDS